MSSSDPETRADRVLGGLRDHERARRTTLPDRYELLGELGRGGMAVVHRARDRQLDREVAVKALREDLQVGPADRSRFRREAEAVAKLSHPHVVTIFDAGEDFLVMELLKGGALRRATPEIIEKVARGIHAAHEKGIVHRDLKPSNILMTESGEPKVADFGIAHLVGDATRLTQSGALIGTPIYMAPEQVQGRVATISPRTDVYALGAILYEGLTRRPPHEATTPLELFGRIVNEEPLAPRSLDSKIPSDLETITLKALEKDPERRYGSALEMAEDLARWREGHPILARPASALYRIRKRLARRKAVVSVGACGALLVALALAILLPKLAQAKRTLKLWSQVSVILSDAELLSRQGLVDRAKLRLDDGIALCRGEDSAEAHYFLGRLHRAKGENAEARAELDRAVDLNSRLGEAHYERGLLIIQDYESRLDTALAPFAGRFPKDSPTTPAGLEELDPALSTLRAIAIVDLSGRVGESAYFRDVDRIFGEAEIDRLQWNWDDATRGLTRVIEMEPLHIGARLGLARMAILQGKYEEAAKYSKEAIEKHAGSGSAYLLHSRALFWMAEFRGFSKESIAMREVALQDAERAIQLGEPGWTARGNVLLRLNEFKKALADFTRSLEWNPRDALTLNHRGFARQNLEDYDGAIADFTAAVEIAPTFGTAWENRAKARIVKGEMVGAISDAAKALQVTPAGSPKRAEIESLIDHLRAIHK